MISSTTEEFYSQAKETTQLQAVFDNFALLDLTQNLITSTEKLRRASFQAQVDNLDNQVQHEIQGNHAILQNPVIAGVVNLYVNKILQESGYQVSNEEIETIESRIEATKAQHQNPCCSTLNEVEVLLRNRLSTAIMCGSAVEANALIDQFALNFTKTTPKQSLKKILKP